VISQFSEKEVKCPFQGNSRSFGIFSAGVGSSDGRACSGL
jgi:hypothetical protein